MSTFHVITVEKSSNTVQAVREFNTADYTEEAAVKYVNTRIRRRKMDAAALKVVIRQPKADGTPNTHGFKSAA